MFRVSQPSQGSVPTPLAVPTLLPAESTGRTTTAESLLGLLSMGPATGYDLRQLIEQSIGNFWNESYGQIYPALKGLVKEGLAEVEERTEGGRPPRKLYRLTAAGHERLAKWLAMPVRSQVPRNELLLKIFFGVDQGPRLTLHHLSSFLEEQRRLHQRYTGIEAWLETEQAAQAGLPYWRLTVRHGLRQTEAMIRWAEDGIRELEQLGPEAIHNEAIGNAPGS